MEGSIDEKYGEERDTIYKEALQRKQLYSAFSSIESELKSIRKSLSCTCKANKGNSENQEQILQAFGEALRDILEAQKEMKSEISFLRQELSSSSNSKKRTQVHNQAALPFFTTTEASPQKKYIATQESADSPFDDHSISRSDFYRPKQTSFKAIDEKLNKMKKRSLSSNLSRKCLDDSISAPKMIFDRRMEAFKCESFLKEKSFIPGVPHHNHHNKGSRSNIPFDESSIISKSSSILPYNTKKDHFSSKLSNGKYSFSNLTSSYQNANPKGNSLSRLFKKIEDESFRSKRYK